MKLNKIFEPIGQYFNSWIMIIVKLYAPWFAYSLPPYKIQLENIVLGLNLLFLWGNVFKVWYYYCELFILLTLQVASNLAWWGTSTYPYGTSSSSMLSPTQDQVLHQSSWMPWLLLTSELSDHCRMLDTVARPTWGALCLLNAAVVARLGIWLTTLAQLDAITFAQAKQFFVALLAKGVSTVASRGV